MPTASPIIVARVGATEARSTTAERAPIPARPMPRPISAVRRGSPMARTDPNERSRTTTATARPMSSDEWPAAASGTTSPPSSASSPASRAGARASSTASTVEASTLSAVSG